jgi:hypothetical protein
MRLRSLSYLLFAAIHCASICSGVSVAAVGALASTPVEGICAEAWLAQRGAHAAKRTAIATNRVRLYIVFPSDRWSMLNALK